MVTLLYPTPQFALGIQFTVIWRSWVIAADNTAGIFYHGKILFKN